MLPINLPRLLLNATNEAYFPVCQPVGEVGHAKLANGFIHDTAEPFLAGFGSVVRHASP